MKYCEQCKKNYRNIEANVLLVEDNAFAYVLCIPCSETMIDQLIMAGVKYTAEPLLDMGECQ